MKKISGGKAGVAAVILVLIVIGYYYHLSNRNVPQPEEAVSDDAAMTAVQMVLARDLDTNYPPTPREVVKYFSEISQCFYNEELTDDEIYQLGMKIRQLYDDELVANQTEEDYIESLKFDIEEFKENKRTIASYTPSSSVDVETFSLDGWEWARLYCVYGIKQGDLLYNSNMVFMLRKDEKSHYKIYGWDIVHSLENETGDSSADGDTEQ